MHHASLRILPFLSKPAIPDTGGLELASIGSLYSRIERLVRALQWTAGARDRVEHVWSVLWQSNHDFGKLESDFLPFAKDAELVFQGSKTNRKVHKSWWTDGMTDINLSFEEEKGWNRVKKTNNLPKLVNIDYSRKIWNIRCFLCAFKNSIDSFNSDPSLYPILQHIRLLCCVYFRFWIKIHEFSPQSAQLFLLVLLTSPRISLILSVFFLTEYKYCGQPTMFFFGVLVDWVTESEKVWHNSG